MIYVKTTGLEGETWTQQIFGPGEYFDDAVNGWVVNTAASYGQLRRKTFCNGKLIGSERLKFVVNYGKNGVTTDEEEELLCSSIKLGMLWDSPSIYIDCKVNRSNLEQAKYSMYSAAPLFGVQSIILASAVGKKNSTWWPDRVGDSTPDGILQFTLPNGLQNFFMFSLDARLCVAQSLPNEVHACDSYLWTKRISADKYDCAFKTDRNSKYERFRQGRKGTGTVLYIQPSEIYCDANFVDPRLQKY